MQNNEKKVIVPNNVTDNQDVLFYKPILPCNDRCNGFPPDLDKNNFCWTCVSPT
ncbi:hypothetical protein HNP25_001254 [Arcicella rosea]|uniref:Uncharacterized protein n=1 Tax=Arcicella rosea TaxID=502909 RepID=A0A841EGV4_9BACT|nr:hypothetical protein [Arcicella rosea]